MITAKSLYYPSQKQAQALIIYCATVLHCMIFVQLEKYPRENTRQWLIITWKKKQEEEFHY